MICACPIIDYAIEENTPFPIPIEGECYVINDAIGTLVLWPIKLVVLEKTAVDSSKNQDKEGDIPTPSTHKSQKVAYTANRDKEGESNKTPTPSFIESQKVENSLRNQDEHGDILIKTPLSCDIEAKRLIDCIMKMDCSEQIIIPIDIGITTQARLSIKIYEYASVTGVSSLFGFLYPSGFISYDSTPKGNVKKVKENKRNRTRYLVDVFKENGLKGKVFFAPYNDGSHWILCAVDLYNNICPRQNNGVDCAYYVMRYMKEIISHKRTQDS
ncbi:Urease subunit alpha [Bienertia sinuspersici]